MAATTGMRRGELLGLKWDDIDLNRRSVQLRRTLQRVAGAGLVEEETKTPSSRRLIALTRLAAAELKEHRVKQAEQRLAAGPAWETRDFVFSTALGRPIDEGNLSRSYKRSIRRAQLPDLRFHDLRHTAATLLLQEGVNPKVVQEMLGHSTIKVTLDLYSHVTPHMQEAAADALDRLFTAGFQVNASG
jgi:integrase